MSINTNRSVGDKVFNFINYLFLIIFSITIIIPFWTLLAQSFDELGNVTGEGLFLWPKTWTLRNYEIILSSKYVWTGYANTLYRTIVGTVLAVIVSSMGAYSLSKKRMPNRTFWTMFLVFTMFFTGGLIPTYLTIVSYGMINSMWVLILYPMVTAYYIVLIRNFFQQLPDEIEESAKIDGANDFVIYLRIMVPLSMPILATVALWVAVYHWNSWFDCLIYITDTKKFVLQVVLHRIISQGLQQEILGNQDMIREFESKPEAIKAACIFVATLPILFTYPYMQRFFVKGVIVGSLKG